MNNTIYPNEKENMAKANIIIMGAPGSGKTTQLIEHINDLLEKGNSIEDFTVCTFRKNIANDIKKRIHEKFSGSSQFIGTIHAICFQLLNLSPEGVITEQDKSIFSRIYNNSINDLNNADTYFKMYDFPGNNETDDKKLNHFSASYESYKNEYHKVDFNDMLQQVLKLKLVPDTKFLIVDEFQDLTPLQLRVFCMWESKMQYSIIAGDPHQSIYPFFGSDHDIFKKVECEHLEILTESHRFSEELFNFSNNLLRNAGIEDLYTIKSSQDITCIHHLDADNYYDKLTDYTDNTFHLVRTNDMARNIAFRLIEHGIPFLGNFGWNRKEIDAFNDIVEKRIGIQDLKHLHKVSQEKILNALRNKRHQPIKKISLYVGTIHSVKGKEADNVFVWNQITKKIKISLNNIIHKQEEARVWYVASTRARKNLFWVDSNKRSVYPLLIS